MKPVASMMRLPKRPVSHFTVDMVEQSHPEEFPKKQVRKLLKQEFRRLGNPQMFLLFETLFSWEGQLKYESKIFDRLKEYTMIKKLGYSESNTTVPEKFAREHKRLWSTYNLDRFASEIELLYGEKVIRFYINS